jgi:hypothetical protein
MESGDTIVEARPGRFGPLSVRDGDGVRSLWCGDLCHGASFLEPGIAVDGRILHPGPVPDAPYQYGWLLAVLHAPYARVLMAGLGSGSGVCTLLHHFPGLRVTVVEVDPAVVGLARRHLPLLDHHIRSGACTVVEDDFAAFVTATAERWEVALLDAYDGAGELDNPVAVLADLRERVAACWLNVADRDGEGARMMIERLATAGWIPRVAAVIRFGDDGFAGNVVVGTASVDLAAAAALRPFAGLDHPNAQRARDDYAAVLGTLFVLA